MEELHVKEGRSRWHSQWVAGGAHALVQVGGLLEPSAWHGLATIGFNFGPIQIQFKFGLSPI